MTIELSPEQAGALDRIESFLVDPRPDREWLVLHGLAGTGKTTLMSELARRHPSATLCAFTGKAAAVLRSKTGFDARTVHSVIYDYKGEVEERDDRDPELVTRQPIFEPKGIDLTRRLVFLDEASMIGCRIAEHLIETGARIVATGDPGQLPPVRDVQFFVDADLRLHRVHRQALESPIIRQAHAVRERGDYRPDGPNFRIVSFASDRDLLETDVVLCWKNVTRQRLNARKRALLGFTGRTLRAGEPVIALQNVRDLNIWNGESYRVTRDREPMDDLFLDVDGLVTRVAPATIETVDDQFMKERETCVPFALGYCLTVHKSQGSEWKSILFIDEAGGADRRQLLYTGITRAIEKCVIVRR